MASDEAADGGQGVPEASAVGTAAPTEDARRAGDPALIHCANCDNDVEPGAFCESCGQPLPVAAESASSAPPQAPPSAATRQPADAPSTDAPSTEAPSTEAPSPEAPSVEAPPAPAPPAAPDVDAAARQPSAESGASTEPTPSGDLCPSCGALAVQDGFCDRCGRPVRPSPQPRREVDLGVVAAISDRGLVRERNEDSFAIARHPAQGAAPSGGPPGAVAVVCDGVASTARSETASQAAADTACDVLLAVLARGGDPVAATREAAAAAGPAVAALAQEADEGRAPSCTFVSAVVSGGMITVGSIGDSRAYWLAADPAESARLTADDTLAAELAAVGVLTPEQAETDPRSHTLSRWLGADAEDFEPRITRIRPSGPGAVLLCSDGLWNHVGDPAVLARAAVPLALRDPALAARVLAGLALLGGGHDNVTVALVPVDPTAVPSPSAPARAVQQDTVPQVPAPEASAPDMPAGDAPTGNAHASEMPIPDLPASPPSAESAQSDPSAEETR